MLMLLMSFSLGLFAVGCKKEEGVWKIWSRQLSKQLRECNGELALQNQVRLVRVKFPSHHGVSKMISANAFA